MRANFDSLKITVEGLSGGKNTVLFDEVDMPSIMVKIPKMKNNQLISSGDEQYHDAFHVDTAVVDAIYMGKYLATVINGRGYSLAGKDPTTSVNFDTARDYCRKKGNGWHLPTNAFYSAIALWSKANKTMPHGNTQWGKDYECTWETGFPTSLETGTNHKGDPAHTATGSGPDAWYHDHNAATGIADLCGNVWEWASGLRLNEGEIQVIPYGNAMKDMLTGDSDIMRKESTEWKPIKENGSIGEPGDDDTFKWDYNAAPEAITSNQNIQLTTGTLTFKQDQETAFGYHKFGTLPKKEELVIPQRIILLGLYPEGEAKDETAYENRNAFWMRNFGERLPIRGGDWDDGTSAGVFSLNLGSPRTDANGLLGFRVAYFDAP